MAEERGIDLSLLRGSGPDGRIIRRDVEGAAAQAATTPTNRTVPSPAAPSPDAIVGAVEDAAGHRPTHVAEQARGAALLPADRHRHDRRRRVPGQLNETLGEATHVSINDLLVRACALALQRFPDFNATMTATCITTHDEQNVCIAIALDDGLIAPAIVDAGTSR